MRFLLVSSLLLFFTVLPYARSAGPVLPGFFTNAFMQPFYMDQTTSDRGLYAVRLDLHLFREMGLRHYRVEELKGKPIGIRELEFELRYDRSARSFLHLGHLEGSDPGFAVAFPIARGSEIVNKRIFALLTVHPKAQESMAKDNFPTFVLHGFAKVEDFDGTDIERAMMLVRHPRSMQLSAGNVLSIRRVYHEILLAHPF